MSTTLRKYAHSVSPKSFSILPAGLLGKRKKLSAIEGPTTPPEEDAAVNIASPQCQSHKVQPCERTPYSRDTRVGSSRLHYFPDWFTLSVSGFAAARPI